MLREGQGGPRRPGGCLREPERESGLLTARRCCRDVPRVSTHLGTSFHIHLVGAKFKEHLCVISNSSLKLGQAFIKEDLLHTKGFLNVQLS